MAAKTCVPRVSVHGRLPLHVVLQRPLRLCPQQSARNSALTVCTLSLVVSVLPLVWCPSFTCSGTPSGRVATSKQARMGSHAVMVGEGGGGRGGGGGRIGVGCLARSVLPSRPRSSRLSISVCGPRPGRTEVTSQMQCERKSTVILWRVGAQAWWRHCCCTRRTK